MQHFSKKRVTVLDSEMAYVEHGDGDPIVFLHGNPTSSYLWRNVIPHLSGLGRCIAPDLIGMGDSGKLAPSGADRYTFLEHRQYVDKLLETLDVRERVTLVLHDWGSALGFHWAHRHADAVRGIAYMESIVQPNETWDDWPEKIRNVFRALRSPAGEEMVLDGNLFVEKILPSAILRTLDDEEMDAYRAPFREPGEGRRPTLTWPRQIPIEGEPREVVAIVREYGAWMAENEIPKLFVNAEPGAILTGEHRSFCRGWKNQHEVTVRGSHFIQEDAPDDIGRAIASWRTAL